MARTNAIMSIEHIAWEAQKGKGCDLQGESVMKMKILVAFFQRFAYERATQYFYKIPIQFANFSVELYLD